MGGVHTQSSLDSLQKFCQKSMTAFFFVVAFSPHLLWTIFSMTTYNGKSLVFETQVSTEICSTDDKSADRPHPKKQNIEKKPIHKRKPGFIQALRRERYSWKTNPQVFTWSGKTNLIKQSLKNTGRIKEEMDQPFWQHFFRDIFIQDDAQTFSPNFGPSLYYHSMWHLNL